jgi:hypothetical protein
MNSDIFDKLQQPGYTEAEFTLLGADIIPYLHQPKERTRICTFLLDTYFLHDGVWDVHAIQTYQHTYWRWFVYGMWQQPLQLSTDIFPRFLSLSLVSALQQKIFVSDLVLSYLDRRFVDDAALGTFFRTVCDQMKQETVPVSSLKGAFTHAQIYTELKATSRTDDSIGRAALLATIKNQFWYGAPTDDLVDTDTQISRYIQFLTFCFEQVNILDIVNTYIDIQHRYVSDELTPEEMEQFGISDVTNDESSPVEQTSSYTMLQEQIEETFGDITTMSPTEIAPVLTYLSEQSELLGESTITNLIYFDTTTNTFVWNTDLLNQS